MASGPRKTLVCIPTYDERDNVRPMLDELRRVVPDYDILFIDDNSPDGTGELLVELARTHPRLKVMRRPGKLGIGGAHLDGIAYAYDHGYDTLVTLDCDFTHSPSDIPKLIAVSAETDITIGSRFLQPDSLPGWNVVRKALTNVGHLLTENVLGIRHDATGAFRVYNLARVPRETFGLVKARGYAFFFESLCVAHQNNLEIREVPIKLPARTYGHSKMSLREIQRSIGQLLTLFVATRTNPAQFRVAAGGLEVDPALVDPQGWDSYWEQKSQKSAMTYELVAALYRNVVIKARLNACIRDTFPPNAKLLHAGCGSGQVDTDLHDYAPVTAIDISVPALKIYRAENPKAFSVKHASILRLPFADASFDGAYNLGVLEHFEKDELKAALRELHRVIRPGGKLLVFWPHAHVTSVAVRGGIQWILNDVLQKGEHPRPREVSLVHSRHEAEELLDGSGFDLESYAFGARDLFAQAVVVGTRRPSPVAARRPSQTASA